MTSKYNKKTPAKKTLPHEMISEALTNSILGDWIAGGRAASNIPQIRPEHFVTHRDQAVWRAILELESRGIVGDLTALVEHLKATSPLDDTDWNEHCVRILGDWRNGTSTSMEHNAEILYDYARRRAQYKLHVAEAERLCDLSQPLPPDAAQDPSTRLMSVSDILSAEVPEPRGPWKGVIPVGLTVLGARPKNGKSILMMQLSTALGIGGMHFGQQMRRTPVLYYALEDSVRRLKDRLRMLGTPPEASVQFVRKVRPLYDGGLQDVLAATQDYGLLIIDTIERSMPGKDFIKEGPLFGEMLGKLQAAAQEHNMSVVAIVHRRKSMGQEKGVPVDDVLGSTHMTTAADCVLCIYRERGKSRAELKGRTRDTDDIELTMEFDRSTVCWQLVGETAEVAQTEGEEDVLDALREMGKANVAMISKSSGKNKGTIWKQLQKLWKQGEVDRELIQNVPYYSLKNTDTQTISSEMNHIEITNTGNHSNGGNGATDATVATDATDATGQPP